MLRFIRTLIMFGLASCFSICTLAEEPWKAFVGKAGPTGWRVHVVQPDPKDHGPDGINFHDWDGDGDIDIFVNYEEGKYSRLYFNPGTDGVRKIWSDSIEFKHGKCEDSGIGDLDNDGDIDYIANGGWIYFNPGKALVRDTTKWTKMTLFDKEQRVPIVVDVDGDGLKDLVVGAQTWYKQPVADKHVAKSWVKFELGTAKWPMNCIPRDVDKDGDIDFIVPDRRDQIFWYENPGKDRITAPWPKKKLHAHRSMFIAAGDVDGDGNEDLLIAGGKEGIEECRQKLIVLLRTNEAGDPVYKQVAIPQPCGNFPKGVKVLDLDGNAKSKEIVVVPKQGDLWVASFSGDSKEAANWKATPLGTLGAKSRTKMDNVYVADIDGDGDTDIVTTEENGGWGVIWFENPTK